ncbi:Phosphotransferase enzyme family protein [Arthrobacter saudimassiliensis]|uniref:Phosphotransferase enzyme family protein n=1 Tax=Arthrobacter saudimassiliensis TaxID=1461584 RepID=A0A078MTN6_9MICC|nr:Phosphotransferase enzyme family protein [Arthrobacter saudimassiliensis]
MEEASASGGEAALVGLLQAPAMEPALAQLLRPLRLRLTDWRHLRTHHRPRAGASAVYRLQAQARDGQLLTLHAVATTAAAPGTVTARVAGTQLRLWLHPRDPQLPDLPWATSAAAVGRDLFDGALPALETLAYRPLRRAVIRAADAERVRYLKVLPPRAAAALATRHVLLQEAGLPVPVLAEGAPPATVATEQAPGTPLVRPLITGSSAGLDPLQLPALLDRLPAGVLALRARPAWSERVLDYARAASVALPEAQARIRNLAEAAARRAAASDAGPVVPVHGDFHPGNLLIRQGQVTGLLDLDAVGPGHRVDDLACFLGHAAVLAAVNPHRPEAAAEAARIRSAFEGVVDPGALAARADAVALTLVAGARGRAFRPRAHEAELRLAAAEALLHRRLPGEP